MTEKRKKLRGRLIFIGITAAVIILLYIWGFMLQTVNYKIKSDKIPNGLKIVFIVPYPGKKVKPCRCPGKRDIVLDANLTPPAPLLNCKRRRSVLY